MEVGTAPLRELVQSLCLSCPSICAVLGMSLHPFTPGHLPSAWGEGCTMDIVFLLVMGWDWRLVSDETLKAKPVVT